MSALKFLILNILKYMEVCRLREVSHFFLVKFLVEYRQSHAWGPIFVPSYDHFYKFTLLQTQTHPQACGGGGGGGGGATPPPVPRRRHHHRHHRTRVCTSTLMCIYIYININVHTGVRWWRWWWRRRGGGGGKAPPPPPPPPPHACVCV